MSVPDGYSDDWNNYDHEHFEQGNHIWEMLYEKACDRCGVDWGEVASRGDPVVLRDMVDMLIGFSLRECVRDT